jgi:ABC-type Fe3+ transport system substrate-binding protein
MYDNFIRELRSEQNDPPLEDLQARVTSMSEIPLTPESLEERNARATEEFQKKWREQI